MGMIENKARSRLVSRRMERKKRSNLVYETVRKIPLRNWRQVTVAFNEFPLFEALPERRSSCIHAFAPDSAVALAWEELLPRIVDPHGPLQLAEDLAWTPYLEARGGGGARRTNKKKRRRWGLQVAYNQGQDAPYHV
jgi:hypothetical protein